MKKTFNLKLMLLGLMASVSSSVWAQYTAKNGVVYDVSGTNATVVGVLSNLPDGKFGQGRYADGTKSIQIEDVIDGKQVTGLANNWKAAGQFANTPDGSIPTPTTTPTENADGSVTYTYNQGGGSQTTKVFNTLNISELANVELVFKATGITEISRSDIDGINVAGFILGGNSGITEIPENLFSGVSVTKVIDQERLDKIAYYQSLIGNSPTWIIEDGVYTSEGKFKGNQVYRVNRINAFSNVAPIETTYVVVDMDFAQKGANWDNDNILVHPAYALSNDGKYTPETDSYWTNVSVSDDGKTLYLWRPAFGGNGRWVEVATAIDWSLGEGEADGLQAIWEKKDAKAKELKGIYDQKSIERSDAEYAKNHIDDTNEKRAEASAKAKALKEAIEAFSSDNAKWTILKGKLQEYFTNVTNVSPWFAAFTLSTADEALLTAAGINKSEWQNEIDAFIPAYTDFYGTAPAALIEYTVHGYAFKSYGATGDIFSHGDTNIPVASSENFQFYANGVVEDCSSVVGDPDATVTIGDKMYFKVKVLQNDIEDFKDKYYYVQTTADADGKPVVNFNSTYYVLFEYKVDEKPANLIGSMTDATASGTLTASINSINPVVWTAEYTTAPNSNTHQITFTDGKPSKELFVIVIPSGEHAGSYVIDGQTLYSVDSEYKATAVTVTTTQKQMIPVTFTPANIPAASGSEASDVMTQLQATLNGAGNLLIATFPDEETTRLTLKVAEKPDVEANSYVEVGNELYPVSTCYRVTEEGEAWNGFYFMDDEGHLYKHVSGATWTVINDPSGRKIAATKVEMNKHTDAVPGTPEVIGQNTTLVVMITKTEDYTYTLTPATAQAAIDSHNPDVDYNPVLENNKPLKKEDLDKAYTDALAAEATAKSAWETAAGEAQTAKDNLDAAQGQLDHWTDEVPEYKDEFVYEDGVKNETLLFVAFNNDVVSVGAHAFAQCEKAKFTGTFKSKLVKIGKEAFLNTLFANLNLSNTGKIDWRGGEPDEDGNPTPDGKIDIEDRLTGSDIAQDAFVGTPLETMKLDATDLGDGWVYNVTRNIKFEDVVYTYDCNQKETRNVNTTLKTVTLPTGEGEDEELEFDRVQQGTFANCVALEAIAIPGQVYQIEADAFNGCDKLATITFATVKPELQRIGARAFQGTAAESINLSNQVLLGIESIAILPPSFSYAEQAWNMPVGIGDYAFAGMPNLKDVNITNTQLTTLPQNVFFGSTNLQGVTFFAAADPKSESTIETLPAGLFRTNFEITALDLSRTQITVLQNLFQARPEKENILDCDGNKIGEKGLWNEKLATFTLPENLKEIKPFALSSLWGLTYSKADPFIIPGTVEELGEGVFYNDKNLVAVKAIDSELTYLPERTFAQCTNLEEVTLVTFETLLPIAFGDKCFFSTKTPDVYVNNDTYELLGANFFEGSYATLKPYAPVIQTIQLGNLYFKPWTSKYGTWVEATDNVGVYTAYQNGSKISLYPAKKSTFVGKDGVRRDYYKIAAYDKDADPFVEIIPSLSPRPGSEPTTKLWSAPAQIDYLLTSRMTFNRSGQYGEGISPIWVDGVPTLPTMEYSDNFSDEVLEKTWLALGTAIIVSNQPDDIPYIQKTNAWQKYQSTLDLANQLCVAKEDIPADNNTNFYFLAEQDGTYKFIHHNDETAVPFIPENAVIFMQDPVYGHLGLARDFDIEFVGEGEATAINGVVERSLNDSEAIFNVQGVRVNAPVKGQMYIQGGKKFIQK